MKSLTMQALKDEAERFLTTVKQRDFAAFKTFFRSDLPFYAELPGGKVFNDIPSFLESQEPWFFGATGTFNYQIQGVTLDGMLGTTIGIVEYSNVDFSGVPFTLNILITFNFQFHDGKWFLVHDHNQVLDRR